MVVEYREHTGVYGDGVKTNKQDITQVISGTVIMQAYIKCGVCTDEN